MSHIQRTYSHAILEEKLLCGRKLRCTFYTVLAHLKYERNSWEGELAATSTLQPWVQRPPLEPPGALSTPRRQPKAFPPYCCPPRVEQLTVGDATFITWSARSCLFLPVCSPSCRLALAGTIQFSSAIQLARQRLSARYPSLSIPKCKPLSPGEVLGCTAPALNADDVDAIVFVADGRCGGYVALFAAAATQGR